MKTVLLAPSGVVASSLGQLALPRTTDDLFAVAAESVDAPIDAVTLRLRGAELIRRVEGTLGGSPAGRMLVRLSPLDRGRRFAAAVRGDAEARRRIAEADLIVVLERDGLLAGWKAAHRWAAPHASVVYGLAAARAAASGG
ncbi:hypothetical protein [Microbacterium sp. NPDC077486]|uniref:hypothetical protein n=1 Tax=Microbacterium sp. NPDC077486 TaxID=3154766 RepID=UPI00342B78A3